MATSYYLSPFAAFLQVLNDSGNVTPGLLLWTYAAGTTTATATYTDITGATPNSNPIQLNAAGRLNNVSMWQQGGVPIKVQFSTNAGTVGAPVFGVSIGPTFDQVSGINDPAALLTSLINPASGSGADLVANAVRSYDIFSSVRAAPVPSLAAGQTLVIDVEGATQVTDTGGGLFYWNATSTAVDDGVNVIKPTAAGSQGRYLRQRQSGFSGTVLITLSGVSGTVTTTAVFYVTGNIVMMRIPQVNGTSNATTFGFGFSTSGLGTNIAPSQAQFFNVPALEDNGAGIYSQVGQINTANLGNVSVSLFKNGNSSGWTNTGTKGISDGGGGQYSVAISWLLN